LHGFEFPFGKTSFEGAFGGVIAEEGPVKDAGGVSVGNTPLESWHGISG
jgi:hypothetical protein